MAVNVHRYEADSNKLVGYLTPFFIRGRKVLQFMSAICSPLNDVNKKFTEWAKGIIEDAVATSQPVVLIWYLNEKFRKYFQDSSDSFQIHTVTSEVQFVFENQEELSKHTDIADIYMPENIDDTSVDGLKRAVAYDVYNSIQNNALVIAAPGHNSTIGDNEYVKRIGQCVKKYLVYNLQYSVVINK